MSSLTLNATDIQEMLSSLFLADLPYDARMRHATGASLKPDFVPTRHTVPGRERIASTVRTMFNIPLDVTEEDTLQQWAAIAAAEWTSTRQAMTFFTSGSTGDPKPTTHDFNLHVQEVEALASVFSDRKRVISFVPRHHIYGFLFSILLPKVLQVDVLWEAPLPAPGLVKQLKEGDLVVAFPLLWGKLREMDLSFRDGIHGVTSTGPCPPETIATLKGNGLERMYEIYGSSETGGVGYRLDTGGGYHLLPYWQQKESGSLIRNHPNGSENIYELQDTLQWTGDTFTPLRRADNGVQVAGINVYPERVRSLLLEHPGVAECAVRLMRPEEGDRLKTLIVPQDKQCAPDTLLADIRHWAKEKLTPYEVPGSWKTTRKLPTNAMGKLQDW